MKRVLTLTTAISVALAGMPPVPLWAQDQGATQAQCPPDQPDCAAGEQKPRKARKPAAQVDGQETQPQGKRQGKPAKPAKPAEAADGQQEQTAKPAKPPKPAKPAGAADAPQAQTGKPAKPAKPARQGQPKPAGEMPATIEQPAEPQPEVTPEQRPAKRQGVKRQSEEAQSEEGQQAKPQRQPKPVAVPQDEPVAPTEPQPESLPAQDAPEVEVPQIEKLQVEKPEVEMPVVEPEQQPKPARPQQAGSEQPSPQPQKPAKPAKPAKPVRSEEQPVAQPQAQRPRQPAVEKPPAPDADTALDDILTADQKARPAARQGKRVVPPAEVAPQRRPQAAIAAERAAEREPTQDRQVKRQRIGEADLRRAGEEFRNPLRPGRQQQQAENDDDDDGLSDLEKAGLVVLGALAVGALLKNGSRVVSNTGDRVVVDQGGGQYFVMKDDDTLLRQPGSEVETETFVDGSIRTTVYRPDGSQVVTVRDASGRVLQRVAIDRYGNQTLLIDDLGRQPQPVDFDRLPRPAPEDLLISTRDADAELRAAMLARQAARVGESFSLQQIRDYPQVRALAPTIDAENVTFDTGSAAIRASEAQSLSDLGAFMAQMIRDNPAEMFLIEGHTDAVGDPAYNLALSDRRAESLALALTEYFDVPPENMVVQGYGESELLVPTAWAEPQNRRTTVRMISPLMQQLAQAN